MDNMEKTHSIVLFNQKQIRRFYDEEKELWYFSIVDICSSPHFLDNSKCYNLRAAKAKKGHGNNGTKIQNS